jgi:LexA DNA binding domain
VPYLCDCDEPSTCHTSRNPEAAQGSVICDTTATCMPSTPESELTCYNIGTTRKDTYMNVINPISREAMRERAAPGRLALHRTILIYITTFKAEHGYAPSMRDIALGIGYSAASPVAHQLNLMQQEGLITRLPHIPRTIAVTLKGRTLMKEKKLPEEPEE